MKLLVVSFLLAAAAVAQEQVQRSFTFQHLSDLHALQEVATSLRAAAEIRNFALDGASKTIQMRGTQHKANILAWAIAELDRAEPRARPSASAARSFGLGHDLPAREQFVRIFYPPVTRAPQDLQGLATAIRFALEIRFFLVCTSVQALVVRADAVQLDAAEWLLAELYKGAAGNPRRLSQPGWLAEDPELHKEQALRVMYARHTKDEQALQQLTATVRTAARMRRGFLYQPASAFVVRANGDTMALAAWLFEQLDQPVVTPSRFNVGGSVDDVAAVLPAADGDSAYERVRRAVPSSRLIVLPMRHALVVRGTAAEVAAAERSVFMKLAFFIAAVAVAQPVALHHVPAGPAMTELGNAVRYTLYTREAPAIDASARTITVQGTPAQVQGRALAGLGDRPAFHVCVSNCT